MTKKNLLHAVALGLFPALVSAFNDHQMVGTSPKKVLESADNRRGGFISIMFASLFALAVLSCVFNVIADRHPKNQWIHWVMPLACIAALIINLIWGSMDWRYGVRPIDLKSLVSGSDPWWEFYFLASAINLHALVPDLFDGDHLTSQDKFRAKVTDEMDKLQIVLASIRKQWGTADDLAIITRAKIMALSGALEPFGLKNIEPGPRFKEAGLSDPHIPA